MGKGVGSNGGSASLVLMQHLFTEHWAGEGACLMCQTLCSASQEERDEGPVPGSAQSCGGDPTLQAVPCEGRLRCLGKRDQERSQLRGHDACILKDDKRDLKTHELIWDD